MPWVCLPFVVVVFPDPTHLLFSVVNAQINIVAKLNNSYEQYNRENHRLRNIKHHRHGEKIKGMK